MNFWRQTTHIMSYFKEENFRGEKSLPTNFMSGFLEVSPSPSSLPHHTHLCNSYRVAIRTRSLLDHYVVCTYPNQIPLELVPHA